MNKTQARNLAKQIFDRYDRQILEATHGSDIPPAFIAGLIANESGRDKAGRINETAIRFEQHVFNALKSIRDNGYRTSNGKRVTNYSGIRKADIADSSDAALRALATSHGITQIMGWHVIHNLRCSIADLRDPNKHLFYTVKLLQLNAFPKNATEAQMDKEMRQWNTGKETGETYHENYVPNAKLIRSVYAEIALDRPALVSTDELEEYAAELESILEYSDPKVVEPFVDNILPEVTNPEPKPEPANPILPSYEVIEQQIPRINTARNWLTTLSAGGILSTTVAAFNGLSPWVVFILGILTAVIIGGLIWLFIKYYKQVFNMVTTAMRINANPNAGIIQLVSRKEVEDDFRDNSLIS